MIVYDTNVSKQHSCLYTFNYVFDNESVNDYKCPVYQVFFCATSIVICKSENKGKKSEYKIKRETRTYSFMKQNIYYIHSFGTYIRIVDVTNNLSSVYW